MYRNIYDFLTTKDLIQTIGISAVMGVDGVILWNDRTAFQNKTMCENNQKYIQKSLGPVVSLFSKFLYKCSLQVIEILLQKIDENYFF
jgi:hypothetical protein